MTVWRAFLPLPSSTIHPSLLPPPSTLNTNVHHPPHFTSIPIISQHTQRYPIPFTKHHTHFLQPLNAHTHTCTTIPRPHLTIHTPWPLQVLCDMDLCGGGWTLVCEALLYGGPSPHNGHVLLQPIPSALRELGHWVVQYSQQKPLQINGDDDSGIS